MAKRDEPDHADVGLTLGALLVGDLLFGAAISPNPLLSAKSALGMLHALALLLLLGCTVITQELIALFDNVRDLRIPSRRQRVWLVRAMLAGTVLALCASFISHSAVAEWTSGQAKPRGIRPELSNPSARDLICAWASEIQIGNCVLWLLLPQALLRLTQPAAGSRLTSRGELEETQGARRVGNLSFFLTCLTLIGYVVMIFGDLPEAWSTVVQRTHWTFVTCTNLLSIAGPPLAVLVAWCLATSWLVRPSRVGPRGKALWGVFVLCATLGMPLSCVTTGFGSGEMHWVMTP